MAQEEEQSKFREGVQVLAGKLKIRAMTGATAYEPTPAMEEYFLQQGFSTRELIKEGRYTRRAAEGRPERTSPPGKDITKELARLRSDRQALYEKVMQEGDEHELEFVRIHNDAIAKEEKEQGRFDPSPSKAERVRADREEAAEERAEARAQ
jgi:hypothetical protein